MASFLAILGIRHPKPSFLGAKNSNPSPSSPPSIDRFLAVSCLWLLFVPIPLAQAGSGGKVLGDLEGCLRYATKHTVDGRHPVNSPVEVGSLSPLSTKFFLHPRWCRISSINSI